MSSIGKCGLDPLGSGVSRDPGDISRSGRLWSDLARRRLAIPIVLEKLTQKLAVWIQEVLSMGTLEEPSVRDARGLDK